MSGGHFDYQQYRLEEIATSIDMLIDINDIMAHYPPDIVAKFDETRKILRLASAMVQRIDWLVSDDDGEDTFRERWLEEVDSLKEKYNMGSLLLGNSAKVGGRAA